MRYFLAGLFVCVLVMPAPGAAQEPIAWAELESPTSPVFEEPTRKSRHVGSLRRNRAFPIYEYSEGPGCREPWARIGPGWVCSRKVTEVEPPPPEQPGPALAHKYATLFQDAEIFSKPNKRFGTGKIRKRKSTVTITAEEKRWVRTFPDQWLERRGVVPRPPAPSTLEGISLTGDTQYPLVIVRRGKQTAVPRPGLDKKERRRLADHERVPVPRFSHHPMLDEYPIGRKWGPTHVQISDGWLDRRAVAILEPVARPRGINEGEKWILVDISEQLAVAYEGDTPVYATIVSTGKEGSKTPLGKWKVATKHRSARMAGGTGDSYHFLSDVPWIQYYSGGYAIHGAYWHNAFGWPRSQGCVNMHPRDAQWFFTWSDPQIPRGWHSYHAARDNKGTWIVVVK